MRNFLHLHNDFDTESSWDTNSLFWEGFLLFSDASSFSWDANSCWDANTISLLWESFSLRWLTGPCFLITLVKMGFRSDLGNINLANLTSGVPESVHLIHTCFVFSKGALAASRSKFTTFLLLLFYVNRLYTETSRTSLSR